MGTLKGKDVLLLLLYSPGSTDELCEPIMGRTRLMKLVFIFEREIYPSFGFDQLLNAADLSPFVAWNFGPFSKEVFSDLEFFTRIGFVGASNADDQTPTLEEAREYEYWADMQASEDEVIQDYAQQVFELTPMGRRYVEERLWPMLTETQRQALFEYKRKFNGTSLFSILEYVYKRYPEETTASLIRDRILGRGATL